MHKPHKNLDVWKLSVNLTATIYRISAVFPTDEKFGLVSQMRRAALSVPSNIAEGAARGSKKEFRRFLSIARASLSELDTQLDICLTLDFLSHDSRWELDAVWVRIDKMLNVLIHERASVKSARTGNSAER